MGHLDERSRPWHRWSPTARGHLPGLGSADGATGQTSTAKKRRDGPGDETGPGEHVRVRGPLRRVLDPCRRVLRTACRGVRAAGAGRPVPMALAVWILAAPCAAMLPAVLDLNPFRQAHADVPLVTAWIGIAVMFAAALWRRGSAMAGMAAGLCAAYPMLTLRTAWHGTPFPPEGLSGDTGRLAAMATRYTVRWAATDGIVDGVPAEYPPLYPWLIGKAAIPLDLPAWRLLAPAAAITVSVSVLAGFALWCRLTTPWPALLISALSLSSFGDPSKAYEVLALAVVVPWLLMVVGRPDRGRLHWLPAGLIGALLVLAYHAYLVFAALGVLVLVAHTLRTAPSSPDGETALVTGGPGPTRRAYAVHLLRAAAVTLALSTWYLVPYVPALVMGGQQLGDLFESSAISQNPLPFLRMTPLGIAQLIGLIGLLWCRRTWWAAPLLSIVAGAYGYYLLGLIRFVATSHTGLFYYAFPLISAALLAAAVLTTLELGPEITHRLARPFPAGSRAAAGAILLAFAAYTYWQAVMPATLWRPSPTGGADPVFTGGGTNRDAVHAHGQPFPDGSRPRFARAADRLHRWAWFPVGPVRRSVESVLGPGARPRTLSYSEQLFAFLPWPGYVGVDRNASLAPARWDDRWAELKRLAAIHDPASFARASAHTRFGAIDVFVLHRENGDLVWRPLRVPGALRLRPAQFDPAAFTIVDGLPRDTVVVVRRPGSAPRSPTPARTASMSSTSAMSLRSSRCRPHDADSAGSRVCCSQERAPH